uniref:Uncharacterized protein n=1 Tax=Setaria viridis TaxID=4556 RepID=A0A4U6TMW9_SETVI|nr:hypothetical protein SEVIR_7G084901v2 [Setaria viridis]
MEGLFFSVTLMISLVLYLLCQDQDQMQQGASY